MFILNRNRLFERVSARMKGFFREAAGDVARIRRYGFDGYVSRCCVDELQTMLRIEVLMSSFANFMAA